MTHDNRQASTSYGASILIDGVPVWKRLRLTEDSILLTRLTRGLLRYIYKVRVDSWTAESVSELMDEYVTLLKRARAINTDADNPDFSSKFGILSAMEDIVLPIWGEQGDVSIDKIGGDPDIRWIVDVDKLENQLAMALRVPLSLLGGSADDATGSLGSEAISKLDVQFAKTAKRLQRAVKEGLTRICQIHLAYMNMDPDSKLFEVNLNETSSEEEEQLKSTLETGADIIDKYMVMFQNMQENNPGMKFDQVEFFNYMNQKILKLNDLDIHDYITIEDVPEEVRELEPAGMGAGGMEEPVGGEEFPELEGEGTEEAEALPSNMAPPDKLPVERKQKSAKAIISEYLKKNKVVEKKHKPITNLDLTAALPITVDSVKGIMEQKTWEELYGNAKVIVELNEKKKES